MHFTTSILQHAGRDFCQAMLSYFHQKELILFNNPNTSAEKLDEKSTLKNSKLKIFSFNQQNLLEEIEAIKGIIREENGEDGEDGEGDDDRGKNGNNSKLGNGQKEASDCSESEPSLDNFENDQLVKLLPSLPKKKSNKN
jgi:hypothetical protein